MSRCKVSIALDRRLECIEADGQPVPDSIVKMKPTFEVRVMALPANRLPLPRFVLGRASRTDVLGDRVGDLFLCVQDIASVETIGFGPQTRGVRGFHQFEA